MARWINPVNFRHASGSNSKLFFEINDGTMYQDHMVLIRNSADGTCGTAPTATNTFNGDTVRRYIAADHSTTLPSVALAGDGADLTEGIYIMCLCNRQNLDNTGNCDTVNEFTLLIGVSFKIIEKPRLGQFNGTGAYGQDIRGVAYSSHNYALKGSKTTGLTLKNSDKLFFSTSCNIVPGAPQEDASVPGSVFDFVDLTGAAVVTKPASLLSDGTASRQLLACYATEESLTNNDNKAAAYVTLQDVLIIIPMPRLGIPGSPDHIRVVTGATPDFQITEAAQGDKVFFTDSNVGCAAIPTALTGHTTLPVEMTSHNVTQPSRTTGSGMFTLPSFDALDAVDDNGDEVKEIRVLKACFAPSGCNINQASNYVELVDNVKVIPEPIDLMITTWVEAEVNELRFDAPLLHAGIEGDMVVIQPINCDGVHLINTPEGGEGVGTKHSAWLFLEAGGIAKNFRLAEAKAKELPASSTKYKVCYATKSSEGWSQHDWKALNLDILITGISSEPPPMLEVPQSVALGADIVVVWNASTELMSRVSQPGAWVGLYETGTCGEEVGEGRHECYIASRNLPVGISAGVVRFTQAEYKSAGSFEVRYMKGDLSNSQGRSCKGLVKSTAGTYLYCMYKASTISTEITVFGSVEGHSDLASVPGLEHVVLV